MFRNLLIILLTIYSCSLKCHQDNYLFVEWNGRLGNNMFQFATAYSISLAQGLEVVADDNKIRNIFSLDYVTLPSKSSFNCKYVFNEAAENGGNDFIQRFNERVFHLCAGSNLVGYFQSDKYFIQHRDKLIQLFSFRDQSIYEKINEILHVGRPISICMHMRLGDYLTLLKKDFRKKKDRLLQKRHRTTFPVMDYDYYVRSINLVLEKMNTVESQCKLFVISDNLGSFGSEIINKIKLAFSQLEVVIINFGREELDLALMSRCDACITSASSFSWWGAWLNQRAQIIVSPKYWFNYYVPERGSSPVDIEMSLKNQYFIKSDGYFHKT